MGTNPEGSEEVNDLQLRAARIADNAKEQGRLVVALDNMLAFQPSGPIPAPKRPVYALVRNTDPATSRLGAALIAPKRGTRMGQVWQALKTADGAWVPGHDLCTQVCGGAAGLRRLRELREIGWPVEARVLDSGSEYRMVL